ncbi:hypothetical protein [Streptomyces sp. SID11385]|uniref:hypothetical protein n=1 Tax=Streptomyces sp. SID11385 TaxID=2706031 RepID=UPI0013C6A23D|nr:hypothetical protein [Streptomyces sp. SID11385]NEA38017.1 hypothetical protein [Streptomyces sp. SID11385]
MEKFLTSLACWHLAPSLRSAVKSLQSAELSRDAQNMLTYVGSSRKEDRIIEVVTHFSDYGELTERNAILEGMASDGRRFMVGMDEIEDGEMRDVLMSAIPWADRSDYVALLEKAGYGELAARIELPVYSDEPPF